MSMCVLTERPKLLLCKGFWNCMSYRIPVIYWTHSRKQIYDILLLFIAYDLKKQTKTVSAEKHTHTYYWKQEHQNIHMQNKDHEKTYLFFLFFVSNQEISCSVGNHRQKTIRVHHILGFLFRATNIRWSYHMIWSFHNQEKQN